MKSIRIVNTKRYWKLIPDKPCHRKSKYGLCKCTRDDIPTIVEELFIPKNTLCGKVVSWVNRELYFDEAYEEYYVRGVLISDGLLYNLLRVIWNEYHP